MNNMQSTGLSFLLDPTTQFITIPLAISIISAFIGARFGVQFATEADRNKRKKETQQTKNRIKDAIIEELKNIKNEIVDQSTEKAEWYPIQRYFSGTRIHVITPAFDSAVHSGHFSLLDQSLQTALGYVYLRIRNCELYNDQIGNFCFTPLFTNNNTNEVNREATRLVTKFNEQMESLKKEIIDILSKLESEKTD